MHKQKHFDADRPDMTTYKLGTIKRNYSIAMTLHIKKILAYLWRMPYWIFLVAFVVSGYISVVALRHNNENMINLRNSVYLADRKDGNIEAALDNLRGYVYGHMNTNLSSGGNAIKPPIQLKYTYDRLQAAEQRRVSTANAQMASRARDYCGIQNPGINTLSVNIDCVQGYINTHTTKANPIPTALYEYDFISPSWSPDTAGWSLLATSIFFSLFVISFLLERLVHIRIRAQDI